jgi:holo-[acyl-carrier protein] synthase
MILGLGLDLTEVARIGAMLERWGERFTRKVFTDGERGYALARANTACHLAARYAAKEALLKALAVPEGISWREIEVVGGGREQPQLRLHGRARRAADNLGVIGLYLTLTHTSEVAAAVVVAVGGPRAAVARSR